MLLWANKGDITVHLKKFPEEHVLNERNVAKASETRKLIRLFSPNVDFNTVLVWEAVGKLAFCAEILRYFIKFISFVYNCKELKQGWSFLFPVDLNCQWMSLEESRLDENSWYSSGKLFVPGSRTIVSNQ